MYCFCGDKARYAIPMKSTKQTYKIWTCESCASPFVAKPKREAKRYA